MRSLIEHQIDLLPDALRTVYVLRDIEELSARDVADALDIPVATVRTGALTAHITPPLEICR